MDTDKNVGGRDRLARAVLAVVLSIVALRWLKAGKNGRGLLASIGAAVFGFNATTGYCGANDALDIDTTAGDIPEDTTSIDSISTTSTDTTATTSGTVDTETGDESGTDDSTGMGTEVSTETDEPDVTTDSELTCAFCGEPIKTGQLRGPNDQGQIVHQDCP